MPEFKAIFADGRVFLERVRRLADRLRENDGGIMLCGVTRLCLGPFSEPHDYVIEHLYLGSIMREPLLAPGIRFFFQDGCRLDRATGSDRGMRSRRQII